MCPSEQETCFEQEFSTEIKGSRVTEVWSPILTLPYQCSGDILAQTKNWQSPQLLNGHRAVVNVEGLNSPHFMSNLFPTTPPEAIQNRWPRATGINNRLEVASRRQQRAPLQQVGLETIAKEFMTRFCQEGRLNKHFLLPLPHSGMDERFTGII
jgi:hypothetical protein